MQQLQRVGEKEKEKERQGEKEGEKEKQGEGEKQGIESLARVLAAVRKRREGERGGGEDGRTFESVIFARRRRNGWRDVQPELVGSAAGGHGGAGVHLIACAAEDAQAWPSGSAHGGHGTYARRVRG